MLKLLSTSAAFALKPTSPLYTVARSRPLPHRTYALSRFPERGTGVARKARRTPRELSSQLPGPESPVPLQQEETPSAEASQLWHTSQRPPTSNPEEGLKRLLLGNETLVIERQIEMLNIFVGFEQSNKYSISNEAGEPLGYIAEEPGGFFNMFSRQVLSTHRPFRALIMDLHGSPVLWVRRPFAWINSRMFVQRLKDLSDYTPEGEPVLDTFAEVQQRWHLWRRRYDLFLRDNPRRILSTPSEPQPEPEPSTFNQIARVDERFLAWDFRLFDRRVEEIAHINRAFRGFGREIFTDTGQYFVRFGPTPVNHEDPGEQPRAQTVLRTLTLDERALVLALAINIDFDYFSRHSGGSGLFGGSHVGDWD